MSQPATVSTPALHNGGSFPEQGQLVEVRRRQWVVGDVGASAFRELFAPTREGLVSLVSVDEDSLGEELQVVWQLEPGARVLDRAGLPAISGCDDANRLEAFLDAVSWGGATNADRGFLQSPFRSGASIESYQLDPVVRAIDMARVNLLIADDVGLGKTIEAGLVIQELLVRHRARTVLVVCPSSLQLKWQLEMQEKFGLEFRIVDTEYLKCLRREQGIHTNPWTSFPRLITSMDWMKSGEALRLIKDVLPPHITYPRKFDILVVDEAHNVGPAMATRYALESQRTSLIRRIAPHFEHRIFLSATPHNGYQESFTSLLELLDDQRFARNVMPEEKQLQRVMVRRLKTDLVDANGQPIHPKREIKPLEVAYTSEEREAHKLLREYGESLTQAVAGTKREFGSQFVMNLLKKRLFSSPRAFSITLEKHRETLAGRGKKAHASALDDRILRKAIGKLEEEYASDEGLEQAIGEAVEEAGAAAVELSADQKEMLKRLASWAETAKGRPDSKAKAILAWLDEHLKTNGKWNGVRVILFTEYRATHGWLFEILTNHGYGGERLAELHGSLDPEERAKVTAAFQAAPDMSPVRVLLATDAASEGIDLQNHCNFLIHVEIPWNPNVMEQRNGRIDRHGQKKTPFVWHPVGKGFQADTNNPDAKVGDLEGDHEYLMRAVVKVEAIREDLGSVGPVIAQQIQEAMSGKRTQLDTRDAEAKAAKAKRFVVAERKLQEKISKLHERLLEARNDFHLSPERIMRAVQVAMELAEKPPLKSIAWPNAPANSVFEVPQLAGSWLRATAGLNHPHTHKRRPITFDHEVAKGRDDVVLAHLNHRLVQMCLRILRAEVWALDDRKTLHRVTVRRSDGASLEHPVVAVSSRLVVTGGNHHRLHEELTVSGGELKPDGFARITQVGRLDAMLEKSKPIKPDATMLAMLRERFDRSQKPIRATADARSDDRLKFLKNTLERRRLGDVTDIAGLLDELARALKLEIEASARVVQTELGFWPENERMQLRRDVDALRARLARIPDEREQEIASIERRYSDLAHRTFPVAVTFILPTELSASQHIEWVNLVEKTGPFLAVGVLDEAFPQGLEKVETCKRQRVRSAYEEWRDAVDEADPQLDALHREWVRLVLEELLEYEPTVLKSADTIPAALTYREPLSGAEVKPDFAVISGDKARLLIARYSPDTDLSAPIAGETSAASPIERMTLLCRATGVRVGLVTDGEQWTLVSIPAEGSSSLGTWYARIWQQETVTLQAFVSLLEVRRCFGPAESNLDSLFLRSLEHQNEVTDTLGEQVHRAVEVLVQAFDRADLDRDRQLLKEISPAQLYEAGLTVMMRLVVLLCAEERKLLLLGEPIYDQHYAVSTLRARLREDKERLGDEVLERRHDAWSRLLAVFRAVFGGIEHETLRLPALGGSLFDPDRFPFLEGRATGTSWRDTPSLPLPIDNRTVLMLLTALQVLEQRTGALLLSYEALDVEQIGHVYEGLLERTVKRVPETTLGLIGSQKAINPNVPLGELEDAKSKGNDKLLAFLLEKTGRSESG